MPRTVQSNGVKSEIKALALFQMNVPVTPKAINDHVKTGDYAAKYVSMLTNTWGFKFTTQRDGRRVVSYTLVGEPKNVAELRAMQPKVKTAKVAKAPKPAKKTATVVTRDVVKSAPSVSNLEKIKTAAQKLKKTAKAKTKKNVDPVEEEFGTSGAIAAVDGDWDSVDGLDLRKLV